MFVFPAPKAERATTTPRGGSHVHSTPPLSPLASVHSINIPATNRSLLCVGKVHRYTAIRSLAVCDPSLSCSDWYKATYCCACGDSPDLTHSLSSLRPAFSGSACMCEHAHPLAVEMALSMAGRALHLACSASRVVARSRVERWMWCSL